MSIDVAYIEKIPGLSSSELCAVLADHASRVPQDQAIVEIGTYLGRTACHLALGASRGYGAHVYAFDPWDLSAGTYATEWLNARRHRQQFVKNETYKAAQRNVESSGLSSRVTLTRAYSTTAARLWVSPEIGLLYIDGDHEASSVRADVNAWRSHLIQHAVIAFDDYDRGTHPGVPTVVDQFVRDGTLYDPQLVAGRLLVARYAG